MKTQNAQLSGLVIKVHSNANYLVKVTNLPEPVLCYLSGKMAKHFIKPEVGDGVIFEMHPSDMKKGRIIRRK